MTRSWIGLLVFVLVLLFILIYSINFYFLKRLYSEVDHERIAKLNQNEFPIPALNLKPVYKNRNPRLNNVQVQVEKSFRPSNFDNLTAVFLTANQWPVNNVVYPLDVGVGQLIKSLQDAGE
jgi:hypothetical protein